MRKTAVPQRAVKRARTLIELMMREMSASLRDPSRLSEEEWNKLFGAKQSMVANLHKLVTALMTLHDREEERPQETAGTMTPQEMEILTAWLTERND